MGSHNDKNSMTKTVQPWFSVVSMQWFLALFISEIEGKSSDFLNYRHFVTLCFFPVVEPDHSNAGKKVLKNE